MSEQILRPSKTAERLGVSRQTLWKWTRQGLFPPSRRIGPEGGSVGWIESEVDEWIRSREVALAAGKPEPRRAPRTPATEAQLVERLRANDVAGK